VTTGIQFTGLASGLDTESIITQLMSLEQQPRNRLALTQVTEQAREDTLTSIRGKLTALKLAASSLGSATLWAPTQSTDTTGATKFTARRTGGAGPGGYLVEVTSLAASEQRTLTLGDTSAASTLTIKGAWQGTGVDINVPAGATVDDVAGAINASSDAGVYAVNVNGSLVLSSRKTGDSANFGFTLSGTTLLTETKFKAGADAVFSVDGIQDTSPTNVVSAGIAGVELTLRAPTTSPVTVNVGMPAPDKTQAIAAAKAFVAAYNDVVTTVRTELDTKRVVKPQNSTDARKGELYGDTMLSGMLDSMRQSISGDPTATLTLAGIGISTGIATGAAASADSVDGKLVLDETALGAALDADPAAVQKLLGGVTDTPGFAQSFAATLDPITSGGGLLDLRIDEADHAVSRINDQLADMDQRISMREAYLRKQFTALETALQRSQSQSADLASRLSSLPGYQS
jgi:flagellar hook-associated protein 2